MNEKMSKRRIQITDLQKQEIEEKRERRLLIIPLLKRNAHQRDDVAGISNLMLIQFLFLC